MNISEYKESIKKIIDDTNNQTLLTHWKKQLEWDTAHEDEIELSDEELSLVKEGWADYEAGNTISLEDLINKRK